MSLQNDNRNNHPGFHKTRNARLVLESNDLIAEYDAAGTVQKRYVHGPGLDEPLVEYAGSGTTNRSYLLADERGSVIGVVNNAGTVTVNKYDEFGAPAAGNVGRFQYTGQMWLSELGLYHYKARVYDPWLGRFLQPDPIGYAGGMNLYGYVGNDPINGRDPFGWSEENDECLGGQPRNPAGNCPPMPAGVGDICYASRINTAPGSGCGGSYYDPSYYSSYYDYLHALEERPRNMRDAFALAEAEGFFRIGPYTIADNDDSGVKIVIGGRGSVFFGGTGGTIGTSVGIDSDFKMCLQIQTCSRLGVGESIGLTGTLTLGEGTFREGNDLSVGAFGNVGLGPFGSMSSNTSGTTGNTSLTGAYGGGVGLSGGFQVCVIRTFCSSGE